MFCFMKCRPAPRRSRSARVFLTASLIALTSSTFGPVAAGAEASARVNVIIGFDRRPGPHEQEQVLGEGGVIRFTYHLVPAIAANVPERAVESLRRRQNVTAVDLDGEVHLLDAELDAAWGVKQIGAGSVHGVGNNGSGVAVAVLDTGIDYHHPDLDANYAGGYDFVNLDNNPIDDHGHGTHVSGTIAGEDDGAGVVGVAPMTKIYALKVLNASGSGSWSNIIAAVQWAADRSIPITSNSYGGSSYPGDTVRDAFANTAAAGVLHIASAGNSGNSGGTGDNVGYPAKFDSVVAVAATDQSNTRASFSSTGPKVELAAPGVSVNSTKLGGGYRTMSGTSMSAPHVAGTAALVVACGVAGPTNVRLRLQQTADDLGDPGRDSLYGFGLVDADEAGLPPSSACLSTDKSVYFTTDTSAILTTPVVDGNGALRVGLPSSAFESTLDGLGVPVTFSETTPGSYAGGLSLSSLSEATHTVQVTVTDPITGISAVDSTSFSLAPPPPAHAMGGPLDDVANAVAVDGAGNVYTAGRFGGTADFDPGPGTFNLTAAGSSDVFISKLDPNGNFLWARAMGGPQWDEALGVVLDANLNIYTAGRFAGTADFNPGDDVSPLTAAGSGLDVFVSKLDLNGNFLWARAMGGPLDDAANAVAVDGAGNVYTAGIFAGIADFDPSDDVSPLTAAGSSDVFVSKLDLNGNFLWARAMGGPLDDAANAVAVDGAGNIYTAGVFAGTADFNPDPLTSNNLTAAGSGDVFVSKLDPDGRFVWARAMGDPAFARASGLAVDGAGVYSSGEFWGTADFDPGPGIFNLTSAGSGDVFVSKLDLNGNFIWARAMGGPQWDEAFGVVLDANLNVYSAGRFGGTADFNPDLLTSNNLTAAGSSDVFVSKLDPDGRFVWARAMGGPTFDLASGLAVDGAGNVYSVGTFTGIADFDPGPGIFNLTSAGSEDVFVAKLVGGNNPPVANDDAAATTEDTSVKINVLANDTDADGDPLTVAAVTNGAKGSATANADGSITYTPAPNWNGTDAFTYTVSDGKGGADTAMVSVTVAAVNDPPNAWDDLAFTTRNTPVTIAVLSNDGDPDGDPLTVTSVQKPSGCGSVSINPDSTVTYQPKSTFKGSHCIFAYTISDGKGGMDTATVTVRITNS